MAIAIAVRIILGKPIFFVQKRAGLNCKPFNILKFRTMLDLYDKDGDLLPDQARTPPFGQWLRNTSLDELPQILNVIQGTMSMVGPRPLLLRYLLRYNSRQATRQFVKPGMTGLAQVSGRNAISWAEKFELDAKYVEEWSTWLDIKIILQTAQKVVLRRDVSPNNSFTMEEFRGTKNPHE